jgi:hypothetical protein
MFILINWPAKFVDPLLFGKPFGLIAMDNALLVGCAIWYFVNYSWFDLVWKLLDGAFLYVRD